MGSIYKITNTVNGKAYIGKTTRDAKAKRINYHLNGHGSPLVSNAVKKYGKDAFAYEILHDGIIPELLDSYEIEEIAKHNSVAPNGYNIEAGGQCAKPAPETKKKLSDALKGRQAWNKGKTFKELGLTHPFLGKKLSDEHRQNLSKGQRGKKKKPRSPEHCRKLSEVQKGKIVSEETRRKLSEARKGKPHTNKGNKFSLEHRRKLSEAHKGKPSNRKGKKATLETRRKISEAGKGRKVSAETRRKMSASHSGEKNPNLNPMHIPAKQFYLTLSVDMNLSGKRKRLREKFPSVRYDTICRWVKKWQSEQP